MNVEHRWSLLGVASSAALGDTVEASGYGKLGGFQAAHLPIDRCFDVIQRAAESSQDVVSGSRRTFSPTAIPDIEAEPLRGRESSGQRDVPQLAYGTRLADVNELAWMA